MADTEEQIIDLTGKPKEEKKPPTADFESALGPLSKTVASLKDEIEIIRKKVEIYTSLHQMIILVMVVAFILMIIAAFSSYGNTQSDLTKSINQLNNSVNCLKWTISSGQATKSGTLNCP